MENDTRCTLYNYVLAQGKGALYICPITRNVAYSSLIEQRLSTWDFFPNWFIGFEVI